MFFLRGTFLVLLLLFAQNSFSSDLSHGGYSSIDTSETNSENQRIFEYIRDTLVEYKEKGSKPPADQLEELKKAKETVELTDEQAEELDKLLAELEEKKQKSVVGKTPTELMNALSESFSNNLSKWSSPSGSKSTKPDFLNSVAESTLNGFNTGARAGAKLGAPVLGSAIGATAGCINGICNALSTPKASHSSATNTAPTTADTPSFAGPSTPIDTALAETSPAETSPTQKKPEPISSSASASSAPAQTPATPNKGSNSLPEPSGVDTTTAKPNILKSNSGSSAQPLLAHESKIGEEKETVFNKRPTNTLAEPTVSPSIIPSESRINSLLNGNPHPENAATSSKESRLGRNVASFREVSEATAPIVAPGSSTSTGGAIPLTPTPTTSTSTNSNSTPAGTYSWRKGGQTSPPSNAASAETSSSNSSPSSSFNSFPSASSTSNSEIKTNRNKTGERDGKATYVDFSPLEGGNAPDLEETLKEVVASQSPKVAPEVVAQKIQQVFELAPDEAAIPQSLLAKELTNRGISSDLSNLLDSTEEEEADPNLALQNRKVKMKQKPKSSLNKMTAGSTTPSKSILDKVFSFFQM